jgi:hypothetical protein
METTMIRGLTCLATALVLLGTCTTHAQDAKKAKKRDTAGANAQVFQLPKDIELNAEQKAKLDELKKEHGPQIAELQAKLNEILSPEQRQARKDAAAKNTEEKLKGKEAQQRVLQALKLTPEQQEKWDKTQKEVNDLNAKVKEKIGGFLTDEQRAKVPGLVKKKAK